jgi:tRNA (cmo5U34)-methyltransferase
VRYDPFADPEFVARYVDGPKRFVPGHDDMRRMSAQLLAEEAPENGHILVVGAGGGLELRHFAEAEKGWRFTGVDPSAQMLSLARDVLGEASARCELIEGTMESAPPGPFDGASCLLTLHMIPDDGAKLAALVAIRERLRPGARFVMVDHCLDRSEPDFERRLGRYARFARESGAPPEDVEKACEGIRSVVHMISRAREEELLAEAGFWEVDLFYAGFSWTGWTARA